MYTRTLHLLILVALVPLAAAASDRFPGTMVADDVRLVRIGEGTFRWTVFKVYDGAFYLDAERPDAGPLDNVARRLVLQYARDLTADQFRQSGDKILRDNVSEAEWDALTGRLARLNAAYRDVRAGDRYSLTYIPGIGTTLRLNGESLVTIEGEDFARAYFGIWLGPNSVKASFRRALLGS
jgi:hypothetical protein